MAREQPEVLIKLELSPYPPVWDILGEVGLPEKQETGSEKEVNSVTPHPLGDKSRKAP